MANPNWTTIKLNEGERIDDLGRCGYKIIQDSNKFCFGIDAVLLSDFAMVKPNEKVVDLCSGNGIIPILLEAKTQGEKFLGIEIQEESALLATRSISANGQDDKVSVIKGDIKNITDYVERDSVNVVTCNPPYMLESHGIKNPTSPKALARHEVACNLDDVVKAAASILKANGRFYMVHRPFRLVEIFETLTKYKLEPKRMRLVHPYADHEPNMVLIEAYLGAKRRITIEKPLVVYESENKYTQEIFDIYGY